MPTYTFKNLETEEVFEKNCPISEMEEMQASGKYKQVIQSPMIVSMRDSWRRHTDERWKDKLRQIRDKHPGSTIDV
jgi:hypothetical protein